MGPKSAPLHIYVFHRTIAVRIFAHLPLTSLLTCMRVSRRFNTLITRCAEMRAHLFLEPPGTPSPVAVPISLHPVFARLNFSAYHPAKAIRLNQGNFLVTCSVRHQFATTPALREIVIRVISGGEWPLDVEITVMNEGGVTVWDVAKSITGYFDEFSRISFGDHFGIDFCTQHEWDPRALMQNHEFLNPESPFPTIYIPDRERSNVFIADYIFNEFAAVPLVLCPVEWCMGGAGTECEVTLEDHVGGAEVGGCEEEEEMGTLVKGDTEEITEIKPVKEIKEVKAVKEVKEVEGVEPAEEMEQAEEKEIKRAEDIKEITEIELVEEKLEQTEEIQDDDVLGSMGSQSMDIDNDSDHRMDSYPETSSSIIVQASTTPRSFTPEGTPEQEGFEDVPFSIKIDKSASPAHTIPLLSTPGEHPPSVDTLPAMEKNEAELNLTTFLGITEMPPVVSIEITAVAPVIFTADANTNLNPETPDTTSIQSSTKVAYGAVDWEEAFD